MMQPMDLAGSDGTGSCTLGDPDHCGTCTTVCPPGMDTAGTERTCSAATAFGTCDIVCKGEYYDVDGQVSNGCEAQDLPIQDSAITAVGLTLPDGALGTAGTDNTNPINLVGQVYGDSRTHDAAPATRPNGREDWYKLTVSGAGDTGQALTSCLGITNFPTDNTFEVCLSLNGSASFLTTGCKQVMGGASSVCVGPSANADDTGTYYVRVRRLSGTSWTTNGYALYIAH